MANQLKARRVQSLPEILVADTVYLVEVDTENCDAYVTDNASPPNARFWSRGPKGDGTFAYIAYASADDGTGFTLTFDADLDYIAIITSSVELDPPVVGDFAGKWKLVRGPVGAGDRADIMVSIAGRPRAEQLVFRIELAFDGDLSDALSRASAADASTGEAVFIIALNGTGIGTVTFDESAAGVVAITGTSEFDPGDVLTLIAPDPRDATLADISITIAATRGAE